MDTETTGTLAKESAREDVRLWTCIARCQVCRKELNRAVHVPENKKLQVEFTAAFNAVCHGPGHSTFSDCNLCPELEWVDEPNAQ